MTPDGTLKLLSEVRDLQIVDSDGLLCGICDDIELEEGPRHGFTIAALLVGPGAYRDRLAPWLYRIISRVAGTKVVRVPWSEVKTITSRIVLKRPGAELGLRRVERKLAPYLGKVPSA